MKKLFFVVLCAVTSMTIGVTSGQAGSNPKGKPFVAINNQIVEVKGSISSLQEQMDILVGRVDTVEERVTANEQAILDLNEQNMAIQVLLDNSLTNVGDINAEIALLQNDTANLNGQIAALAENDPAFDALQSEINANASMITTLEGSILMVQDGVISLETSLQEQIDGNSTLIAQLQAETAQIQANLELKQNLINGICPDGTAVIEVMADGSIICAGAGSGISGQLESVYSYKGANAEPGFPATARATCNTAAGYVVTGSGILNGKGWSIEQMHTSSNSNVANDSVVTATNNHDYATFIQAVATCTRIKP